MDYEYNNDEQISLADLVVDEKEEKKQKKEEAKRRKHYKFSDKKHPRIAILSSCLAGVTVILFAVAVFLAARSAGTSGIWVGTMGALGLLSSLAGFICGVVTFRKTDCLYGLAWLGVIANGLLWLGLGIIVAIGF